MNMSSASSLTYTLLYLHVFGRIGRLVNSGRRSFGSEVQTLTRLLSSIHTSTHPPCVSRSATSAQKAYILATVCTALIFVVVPTDFFLRECVRTERCKSLPVLQLEVSSWALQLV